MKKLTIQALLITSLSFSAFATGTSSCSGVAASGCDGWWANYTLGTSTDGVFAQSSGVGVAYTANYTSASASQDSLSATFPWISAASTSAMTTSNTTDSSFGNLLTSVPTVVATTSNTSTVAVPLSNFGDVMSAGLTTTTNVATYVSTNTGTTAQNTTSGLNLFTASASNSYSSYLQLVYGGNRGVLNNADPIVPEPSSYVSLGMGLAAVVAYARRKKSAK